MMVPGEIDGRTIGFAIGKLLRQMCDATDAASEDGGVPLAWASNQSWEPVAAEGK